MRRLEQQRLRMPEQVEPQAVGEILRQRDEWLLHHAWQGRTVRVLRDGQVEKEGLCQGADGDGALLVQTAAGLERCLSGDVSLRVAS